MLLGDVISPRVSEHTLLTGWQHDPISLVALAVELGFAATYLLAARRLALRGRRWSRWRQASFLASTLCVVVAVQSGLAAYDHEDCWVHVIQHLLLRNGAPVLFALTAPMTLALQASSCPVQQRLLAVPHHPVVKVITHPVTVLVAGHGTMLFSFLTPFYNFSLEHPLLHDFTHLHFLVSGCVFWWLIVGLDPGPWRLSQPAKLGLLAVGIPVTAVLDEQGRYTVPGPAARLGAS